MDVNILFSRLGGIIKELLWVNNYFVYLDLIGFELTFKATKLICTLTLILPGSDSLFSFLASTHFLVI